jgi:hypothetical protein
MGDGFFDGLGGVSRGAIQVVQRPHCQPGTPVPQTAPVGRKTFRTVRSSR